MAGDAGGDGEAEAVDYGAELIAAGYRPGAGFKEMLRAVEDAQLEGTIASADEALRLVRERFGEAAASF